MILDIKSIMIDTFTKILESNTVLIVIIFLMAIVVYIFRHYIAYDLNLTRREKSKLTENALLVPIIIAVATIGHLYIKEQYFLLSLALSVILTYFLYLVGFVDMLVGKWR